MTYQEISIVIKTHSNKREANHREKAIYDYTLAALIGKNLARCINEENKVPLIFEVYSGLDDLKEKHEKELAEQRWRRIKAQMESYNEMWKANKEVQNGNNS